MIFETPIKTLVMLYFIFMLLPIMAFVHPGLKSSYWHISRQKKLWIILLVPLCLVGIYLFLFAPIFLPSSTLSKSTDLYMFLGKLLLILFIIFGPLCIFAFIYKIRWTKNHTGYAILKLEQKTHLTAKEGIRFLSIDKKPLGKSKNALQFFEKILITPGKHRVEFCKFTQLFSEKSLLALKILEKNFYFILIKTQLITLPLKKKETSSNLTSEKFRKHPTNHYYFN